jgi:hypothetical protein
MVEIGKIARTELMEKLEVWSMLNIFRKHSYGCNFS